MKIFNFINLLIFIFSFSVLTLISYLFIGSYAFSFEMNLFFLNWIIFSYIYVVNEDIPISMKRFKEDIKNKFLDKNNLVNIRPELNHENIKVREYYLNEVYYKKVFSVFLMNLFFPFYVFSLLNLKRKINKSIFKFFDNNFLINYYFNKKKSIIIEKRKVIENHKEYDVFLYLDGKEEYRYKNQIHRENGAAILYSESHFFLTDSINKSKFFIHGKKVNKAEMKKELKKYNINNF